MTPYSVEVLDHFRAPRNAGRLPADAEDVGTGDVTDAAGKRLRLQLRTDARGRVTDARFKAFGCPVTIACGSWATLALIGRTLQETRQVDAARIARELGLRVEQLPLADAAVGAIRAAVAELSRKRRRSAPQTYPNGL